MERILFGDNQFFGVNHMSEEKARSQAMRFQDINNIIEVLQAALQAGAGGFMCTTHDTIEKIADDVRANPAKWAGFTFYPGMPYAHKYANAVTELGYFDAMRKFLPKEGLVDSVLRGSKAVLGKDIESLMTSTGRCRDEDVRGAVHPGDLPAERRHRPAPGVGFHRCLPRLLRAL